jgi:uncharacterized protein YjbI with pentapeptide repeats
MRTITNEALAVIMKNHHDWLKDNRVGERADLSNAKLSNAKLSNADLSYADLRNADLSYADLSYADLRNADLSYADLSYADLSNAELTHCITDNRGLSGRTLRGLLWPVYISPDFKTLSIGCQTRAVVDWSNLSPESPEIREMHSEAPAFWAKYKAKILALCEP